MKKKENKNSSSSGERNGSGIIKVILADDHTIVRQGIETLLEGEDDIQIIAEASDGYELIELVQSVQPDVAIVDISMPRLNGLETTRRIKNSRKKIKVILLSMYDDDEYVRRAVLSRADGYVLKEGAIDELVGAIHQVIRGNYYFSPRVLTALVQLVHKRLKKVETTKYDELTSREREVLQLIAEGNSNKQIADILSRSVETVRTHRANVMDKLDLHSAAELTRFAVQQGIVKEDDI